MPYDIIGNNEFNELERLRRLSITDELTGLLNRRYFFNRLSQEISKSQRKNRPFSILIMDVDHFKQINDTYGHLEGDEVLRVVAKALLKSVREMDVVTRYAGDEFIAILPEATKDEALPVAYRILEETQNLRFIDPKKKQPYKVGVSLGISTFPNDGKTATELIEKADHGLYTAKKAGRNRVCLADHYQEDTKEEISFDGIIPNFVGRENELQKLIDMYKTAHDSKLQIVFIAGEAGIGKTRLIQQFFASISKENIQFLKGTCFDTKIPMPYQPFREALANFVEREEYYIYSILRNLSESAKIEILKIIPGLDVKRLGIKTNLPLEPIQDEYRLFNGIYQILKKISERGPLVLFLDDIHWADIASLELFSYLVRNSQQDRIMICLTYRPEEITDGNIEKGFMVSITHKLSRIHKLERIRLTPFSKNHINKMLQSVFTPNKYPEKLASLVFSETEGNPFFVEELLKSMIENSIISFSDGEITLKPTETINMPSSIRDLVMDRIEKLADELQEILMTAATIGQEFSLKLLSVISDKNEGHIQDILDNGIDTNIIKEDFATSEEKFSFTHCKMREVLYYSMRESKRERLHLKIAKAMQKLYHNNLGKHYEDLAQHYYLSRDKKNAFKYMMLCGQKVQESYATHDAISYFNKTISIYENFSDDLKETFKTDHTTVTLALGKLYNITGEYEKALHWLSLAGDLDPNLHEVYLSSGEVYVKKGDYEKALDNFKIAMSKTNSDHTIASIETNMSYVYFRMSDFNESEKLAKKAIKQLEDKKISLVSAEAYKNLGTVYYAKGIFTQAITFYSKSLEISTLLNDKRAIANSYNNLGSVYYRQNDYDKAIDHLEKCLEIRKEIGDKSGIVYSYNNIGNVYYNREEYKNAEKYYLQCLNISEEIGEQAAITASHNNLANVYLAKENFNAAEDHYKKSLAISKKIKEKSGVARAYTGLGNVCVNKNQPDQAYEYYKKCYDIRKIIGDNSGMAFANIHMAFASISLGDLKKAERNFKKSIKLKKLIADYEGMLTISNQLTRLYIFSDNHEKAGKLLDSSLGKAQPMNLSEILTEIWGLYSLLHIYKNKNKNAIEKSIQTMENFVYTIKPNVPISNFVSFVRAKYAIYSGDYKKALPLLDDSLNYRSIQNSDIEYGCIILEYATALTRLKRFEEASEKLHTAKIFFTNISMKNKLEEISQLKKAMN